jgi:hypothetical protein
VLLEPPPFVPELDSTTALVSLGTVLPLFTPPSSPQAIISTIAKVKVLIAMCLFRVFIVLFPNIISCGLLVGKP